MSKEERGQSEMAKLLRQVDAENEAAQRGLTGYAEVSQHEFITARMDNIGKIHEELERLVGPEEATRLIVEAMSRKEKQGE